MFMLKMTFDHSVIRPVLFSFVILWCFVLLVCIIINVYFVITFSDRQQVMLQVDASDVDLEIMREREEAMQQLEVCMSV